MFRMRWFPAPYPDFIFDYISKPNSTTRWSWKSPRFFSFLANQVQCINNPTYLPLCLQFLQHQTNSTRFQINPTIRAGNPVYLSTDGLPHSTGKDNPLEPNLLFSNTSIIPPDDSTSLTQTFHCRPGMRFLLCPTLRWPFFSLLLEKRPKLLYWSDHRLEKIICAQVGDDHRVCNYDSV